MRPLKSWWNHALVQAKVWAILLAVFLPLITALVIHVTLVSRLLSSQQQRHQIVLAREQVQILRRLAVDIEDAFRGYLLTQQPEFLTPLREAEAKLAPTMETTLTLVRHLPALTEDLRAANDRLTALLKSKEHLIGALHAGRGKAVSEYVRSGQGLKLSEALRNEFRRIEDRLDLKHERIASNETSLAEKAFWGLAVVVLGAIALGLMGARLLARSITGPLAQLQASVARLGDGVGTAQQCDIGIRSADEIGQLARSYEDMAQRIKQYVQELETLNTIGHEISSIGPDGLEGVLRRITDRTVELLRVDVCLVLLRDDRMGCWIVEAASEPWDDRLHKSVLLWEEFPVAVQAFTAREPVLGPGQEAPHRPEIFARQMTAGPMLAIPLLSEGRPFGVLLLLKEERVSEASLNIRLAKGLAAEAAIALSNARLYEAAKLQGKGLRLRLRQLEHLAETLAHDLKAPGERMEALASLLRQEYAGKLDERATRWLRLIEQNGKVLTEQVQDILEVARVGGRADPVEAVDPAVVIQDVLKARADELAAHRIRVQVEKGFPMIACHRAYLRQVFDNLISNAVKFSAAQPHPEIRLTAERKGDRIHFSISDNGIGIAPEQRERVFEPFVRLNPSETKGSGIGLAIVKRIVELYGGQAWIEAHGEQGCTVTVTFPVLADLSGRRPCEAETIKPDARVSSSLEDERTP